MPGVGADGLGRPSSILGDEDQTVTSGPTFSILMRTTGRVSDVSTALASVVAQTVDHGAFEVVVVNDGGPTVAEAVDGVGGSVAVRLVELAENVGKSEAINVGFRHARGRYLCILDDDDAYLPEHLAVLREWVTNRPEAAILYTDTEIVLATPAGRRDPIGTHRWEFNPAELFMMRGAPIACSICIRRDAWSLVGGFDGELARVLDDWDFYMRLCQHFDFVHVPTTTSQYTQPGANKAFLRFPSFEAGLRRIRGKMSGFKVPMDAALALDVALDKLRFDRAMAATDITLANLRAFAGSTPQDTPLRHSVVSIGVLDPVGPALMSTLTMAVFTVEIVNVGDEPWSSNAGRYPIHLSYHWMQADGDVVTWDGIRTPLPYDLAPGGSATARLLVLAPELPGVYEWKPAVVQEGIDWIAHAEDDHGPASIVVRVEG